MKYWERKTKNKSGCCDALIYIKCCESEDGDYRSEEPICSKCLEFPKAPISVLIDIQKSLLPKKHK